MPITGGPGKTAVSTELAAGRARSVTPGVSELARSLSPDERKRLLSRIEASLSLSGETKEQIIHSQLRKERRQELIAADMNSLTFWERLIMWFRRLVSGTTDEKTFITLRLSQLRQRVLESNRNLVSFENRTILPGFAEQVYELYRAAYSVQPVFQSIWSDREAMRKLVEILLRRRTPDAKTTLNEFVSSQELQEVFRTTESRGQLKKMVVDRIAEYVNSIPDSVIKQIEKGLLPLYYFKEIVLFDYAGFFAEFQVHDGKPAYDRTPTFAPVRIERLLAYMEELYLGLHHAGRLSNDHEVFPEIYAYYCRLENEEDSGEITEEDINRPEVAAHRRAMHKLYEVAGESLKMLHLREIIRYFREDPYYRFMAYVPKLRLLDFYHADLNVTLLQTLDERFNDLRMGVIGQMIQEIFPESLKPFEYFHPEVQSIAKRAGINALSVYRTLQIIKNFLEQIYRPNMLGFIRIVGRMVSVRTHSGIGDLNLFVAGLDEIQERISGFDMSFSPDSDDGKTIFRYRFATDMESLQQTAFKAIMTQKERESTTIIEKFLDEIHGVKNVFQQLKKSKSAQLDERYQQYDSTSASDTPFQDKLDYFLKVLDFTDKVVVQMRLIESTS